ncbi:MAG: ParB N-terminal domain-containing protein, partial [Anaerolineaceae bacterium]|nr:ParB N-terminal domain-containing protein [Anaerolineaceae bacterium]
MAHKGGLGKGLDALIPGEVTDQPTTNAGVAFVQIDLISPNPLQPRSMMRTEELDDLANSIREHGVLQPLVVTFD